MINYFLVGSSINNLLWSVITYGSFISFLVALLLMRFSPKDIGFVLSFSIAITLGEILIGYTQMVLFSSSFNPFSITSAAGDYFTGTFMRFGFAHVAAIKISLVLIYVFVLWIDNKSLKRTSILVLIIVGWLLPSALYSIILLLVSIFLYFTLYELIPRLKKLRFKTSVLFAGALVTLGIFMFSAIQIKNVKYISRSINTVINTLVKGDDSNDSSQKIHFFKTSIVDVPQKYPQSVVIGVGPGNYSSRSAWIVSGLYLDHQPFYIPVTPSGVALEYSLPYYEDIVNKVRWGAGSIIHQPFSSWISIYVELGIIGIVLFIWLFRLISRRQIIPAQQLTSLSKGNTIALIYLILLMVVDNILEYPHIINQFLILVVMTNNVTKSR